MTKEQQEKALLLYMQGMVDREISKQIGCTMYQVHTWRTRNGLKPNGRRVTDETLQTIIDLNGNGYNDVEIAKQMGVPFDRVTYWRRKLGLPVKRGRPARLNNTATPEQAAEEMQIAIDICLNCDIPPEKARCGNDCARFWQQMNIQRRKQNGKQDT